ncbi:MAG: zinc-dependent alcohol dehydrogenase family protein [Nitrospira sp.]
MKAMVLTRVGEALQLIERPTPDPGPGQVLVKITACGVCRTDLHLVDGELENPALPIIPGHEIVGHVAARGASVINLQIGQRVGIPWLGGTCQSCGFCTTERENLCDNAQFTGYTIDGGYADYTIASADYCFPLETPLPDVEAAPLLCAGLIGYRCLRFAGDVRRLGIYGFGAAADIIAQVVVHQGRQVFAFTRPGDKLAQEFARKLGAVWAGGAEEIAPERLDAAIVFAPVGPLVPLALKAIGKGGTVVLGGIHMSDIPAMPYAILWGERRLQSVANLTRQDAVDFLEITKQMSINTRVEPMPLAEANTALNRLRSGNVTGALVLVP